MEKLPKYMMIDNFLTHSEREVYEIAEDIVTDSLALATARFYVEALPKELQLHNQHICKAIQAIQARKTD